jgi:hypothetical protein
MNQLVTDTLAALQRLRVDLRVEKRAQQQIHEHLIARGLPFKRDAGLGGHRLDSHNIPDLFCQGIAIEVKLQGQAREILNQCKRYCSFDEVQIIILCSAKPMGFPRQINNKPAYMINLSRAWL